MQGEAKTIPIRPDEAFDVERVEQYLRQSNVELPDHPLAASQFPTGHSNLTYLLTCGEWKAVLRRPPNGNLPPKAHDMQRETRLLSSLHPLFPLAPKPYVFCEDRALIGTPFFVMELREGVVVDLDFPPGYSDSEQTCRQLSEAVIDTLVSLHAVEYRGTELERIGRPEGYMERQIVGWIDRYSKSQTHDIPSAERAAAWLVRHIPDRSEAAVIHNDFKLNNLLLHPHLPPRVTGVLDWEMATLGDPLSDLAIFLSYWAESGDPDVLKRGSSNLTTRPGFYSRDQLIQRYAEKSGRDIVDLNFYLAFAYYKVATIVQQIYYRYHKGQTADSRFAKFDQVVSGLMEQAAFVAKL